MADTETRTCQSCKADFALESEDIAFYENIKVPPPTWCPECRMTRRMLWRNEYALYRRKCDATGKDILSMYSTDKPFKVYESEYWKSDAWDPMDYGREYDFERPFFEQFRELFEAVPHPNFIQKNVVNCDYGNYILNSKNCYFIGGADGAEDCGYMFGSNLVAKDSFDTYWTSKIEGCYEVVECEACTRIRFSQACISCTDSFLLYDCRNCMDCIGCVGLRNKQYCIFNQQYSREEYLKEAEKLKLHTTQGLEAARSRFEDLKKKIPRRFAVITKSENVTGNDIANVRNCRWCFAVKNDVENCRYAYRVLGNCRDGGDAFVAWNGTELFHEVFSITAQRVIGSALIWGGYDIYYSYHCFDCNNVFGCAGLKNRSYCIFNKQYSKEEYEELVPKIIKHMSQMPYVDPQGREYRYGEFFPVEMAPFAYNESVAQGYFPKSKEEALKAGFSWKDPEKKEYAPTKKANELPGDISEVGNDILKEVIECAHNADCDDYCSEAFRITPQELQFLKKYNLPLPRLCPVCRRGERLRLRTPLRLWSRKCQCPGKAPDGAYENTADHFHGADSCPNEFETPYAPDRPEVVYCEQCYQAEVV